MRVSRVVTCLFLFLLTACATVQKPPLVYSPGSAVDTLSASVSLSVKSGAENVSGNGVMIFRRPDQFHFVMLSPFGSTVLEAFALGDQLTLVYPSQAVAFRGRFDELPDGSGMEGWHLLRWVMDTEPSATTGLNGTIERTSSVDGRETVTYESGLVTAKATSVGERVAYRAYELVNGVPFASEMEMHTTKNDRIRIVFEDPEVNTALDKTAFTPRLDGLKLLPLSAMPHAVASGGDARE